jgi:hypothetical protein
MASIIATFVAITLLGVVVATPDIRRPQLIAVARTVLESIFPQLISVINRNRCLWLRDPRKILVLVRIPESESPSPFSCLQSVREALETMRGCPWDSLPGVTRIGDRGFDWTELPAGIGLEGAEKLARSKGGKDGAGTGTEGVATNETPRDFKKDMVNIGRRVMFGGVIGALSGAAFGSVDVVKDVKGMLASRKAAATKVMQYSVRFATFNATYQALQYSLNLYSGLEPEVSFGGTLLRRSSSFPSSFFVILHPFILYLNVMLYVQADFNLPFNLPLATFCYLPNMPSKHPL